ncbi:MAG: hypothetical protein QM518_03255, partial [Verrucomicrobiota bacterium]|nr:hypothetical protein [Verrucomicrobiota bacterium]
TSALPGSALPGAVRLGRGFLGWCWLGWRGGGMGGVEATVGAFFGGMVGVGNGVGVELEPTGTSALPGSALPGSGAVSVSHGRGMGFGHEKPGTVTVIVALLTQLGSEV